MRIPTCSPPLREYCEGARPRRLFEVGCGNGAVANWLQSRGIEVAGIDFSESGISEAHRAYPGLRFRNRLAYDDLAASYGHSP